MAIAHERYVAPTFDQRRVEPDGGFEVPVTTTVPTPAPPRAVKPKVSRGEPRSTAAPPPPARAVGDLLDALAWCETRHRNISSASGRYHGYFQWARYWDAIRKKAVDTWKALGGSGLAEDHSYDEQKAMAAKIPVSSWDTQFPGCARKLGVA